MFGISFEHLMILLVAGFFILGPQRLPEAAAWLGRTARQVREYAHGAREQIRSELGPDFDELRKPLQDLNSLRQLNPKTMVGNYLLDGTGHPSGTPNGLSVPGTSATTPSPAPQSPQPDQSPPASGQPHPDAK